MAIIKRCGLMLLAAVAGLVGWESPAEADWAACQAKPTRACLIEEAFRGDSGPLTVKDRLDVMIQGGALGHPETLSAADLAEAQRLAQAAPNLAGMYYAFLAIQGRVAANQKPEAIDLVASLAGALQTVSITEITRDLVKADDLQAALALPDRMRPPPDPKALPGLRNRVAVEAIKALAETGKTDQALMLIADQKHLTEADLADLQAAVGQAFAKRGDAKLAQGSFDQAERNLEAARRLAVGPAAQTQLAFASVRLLALGGKTEAVSAALAKLRASPEAADPAAAYPRDQGYQRVVGALLEARQPEPALALAKSLTPDAMKDAGLAQVGVWDATNGRLAEAKAVLSSMSPQETGARVAVLRNLALASAKAGDLAGALRLLGDIHNPLNHRGALFALAQALPR